MDKELREYFDRQFKGIEKRFKGVDEQFKGVDEQFRGVAEQFKGVDEHFKGVNEKIRQTHIMIEGVRGLVEQVAEGVVAVGEQQRQNTRELKGEISEVRDLLVVSYRDLDQRLRVVESS